MSDPLDAVFATKPGMAEQDFPGKRPLRSLDVATKRAAAVNEEWDQNPLKKFLNGVETEFFLIGHLADAIGRTPITVRSWEAKGWLPLSKYRTAPPNGEMVPGAAIMGRRLYTRHQIEVVIAAAAQCGVNVNRGRNADWKTFAHTVLAGWKTTS